MKQSRKTVKAAAWALLLGAAAALFPAQQGLGGDALQSASHELRPNAVTNGGQNGLASASHELNGAAGELGTEVSLSASHELQAGLMRLISFPGAVTTLAPALKSSASVTLSWSAPGIDGFEGALSTGTSYFIQSGTDALEAWAFGSAQVSIATHSVSPGATQYGAAPAQFPNTTYYFRLWTRDPQGNLSGLSNGATTMTLARGVQTLPQTFLNVFETSVTANWAALPAAPSSATSAGYRLDASASAAFDTLVLSSATASVTRSTLTVAGLTSDTTYYFRVVTFNLTGDENYTDAGSTRTQVSVDFIPPDPMNDLAASTVAANSLRLTWSAPFDPTNDPLDGNYAIQYATWSGAAWSTAAAQVLISTSGVASGVPQSAVIAGLDPNTTYYFRIWTSDLKPNWSAESNLADQMTLSTLLQDAAFTLVSSTRAAAGWTALPPTPSSGSAAGYRLEASTAADFTGAVASSATASIGQPALAVAGLEPNTTYYFRAASLNVENAPNFGAAFATSTLAEAPQRLATDHAGTFVSSAAARWAALPPSPSSATAEGYRLEASSTNFAGGTTHSSATASVALSTLTVAGLSPNLTYYFRVGSLNWNGAAHFTVLDATSTLANAPGAPQFAAVAASSATVSWGAPAGGAAGFRVEASTTGFDGTGVTLTSATSNVAAGQLTVSALDPNTTYYFRAAALNWRGAATYALLGATVTRANAAGGVQFSGVFESSAAVSWTPLPPAPSSATAEGYLVEASSTDFDGTGTVFSSGTADAGAGTLSVAGLTRNTTYFFRMGTLNWTGAANYVLLGGTSTLAAQPGDDPSGPFAGVFSSSVSARWDGGANPAGSTLYALEASSTGFAGGAVVSSVTYATAATPSPLLENTTYAFRVRALNHNGVPSADKVLGSTSTLTQLLAANVGSVFQTSMTVTWTPVASQGYELQASSTNFNGTGTVHSSATASAAAAGLTVFSPALLANTTYYLRAGGINHAGARNYAELGPRSSLASPVSNAQIYQVGQTSTTLNWTPLPGAPQSATAEGYVVEAALTPSFATIVRSSETADVGLSTLTVTNLAPNTTYYFRVGARNWDGTANYAVAGSTGFFGAISDQAWKVQSFQGTMSAGTLDVAISPVTSLSRAFIVAPGGKTSVGAGNGGVNQNANEVLVRARFIDADTVRLTRDGSTGSSLYSFYVVENPNGGQIKVTAGSDAFTGNTDVDLDIAVGGVTDFTKTAVFLTASGDDASRDFYHQAHVYGWMTSNTNLALRRTAGNSVASVDWFVVEFIDPDWTVQTGQFALTTGSNAAPQTQAITSVNTANSFVHMTWGADTNGVLETSAKVELTNATTLSFSRQSAAAGTVTSRWFVISNPRLNVQRGSVASLAADAVVNQAVAPVDQTLAFPLSFNDGGGSNIRYPRPYWRASFTTPTNLQLERSNTGTLSNFRWQAVEFTTAIPPAAVTDLAAAVGGGLGEIGLAWTAPGDDGSAGALNAGSQFRVQHTTSAADAANPLFWSTAAAQVVISTSGVTPGAAQSRLVDGLLSNATYFFRIWTGDESLNYASLSNGATVATRADAPTPLSPAFTAVFNSSVTARWTAMGAGQAAGYRLEASSTNFNGTGAVLSSATASVALSTLTVSSLDANTTYYFRAAALNWAQVASFSSLGSTSTLANAVSAPRVLGMDVSSATLDWTALAASPQASSAEGYVLEASSAGFDGSGAVLSSATFDVSRGTLTLTGLVANTTYAFRVASLNWNAAPNYLAAGSSSTLTDLATAPQFAGVFVSSAALSWTAPASGAAGYRLEASSTNFAGGTVLSSVTASGLDTDLAVPGLAPNTTYFFRVGALNWNSTARYAAAGSTSTLTDLITAPQFTGVFLSSAALSWTAPAGGAAGGYALEASSTDFSGGAIHSSVTASGLDTDLAVSGLSSNTTYFFRVTAFNANGVGRFAAAGSTSTLTNLIAAPQFTGVFVSSAALSWTAPAGGAAGGYALEASSTDFGGGAIHSSVTASGLDTDLAVPGLDPNTTYFFRVGALNSNGVARYAAAGSTSTLTDLIAAPQFTGVFVSSAALSWTAPAGGAAGGYALEASSTGFSGGTVHSSVTASGLDTDLQVSGLSSNTTYFFRVTAYNANGVGRFASAGSTATLTDLATAPQFTGVFVSSAAVSWTAPAGGAAGGYALEASTDFAGGTVYSSVTASGLDTDLTVLGLDPNTTYFIRLGALNANGVARYAAAGSTSTLTNLITAPQFTGVFVSSAALSWTAPAGGAAGGYALEASSTGFAGGAVHSSATASGLDTDLAVSGLSSNTTYFFRVTAFNANGVGRFAAAGSTSTLTDLIAAPQFSGVFVSSAALSWTAPAGGAAGGYALEASSTGFSGGAVYSSVTASGLDTDLAVPGLDPNTTYFFRVGAFNSNGVARYAAAGSTSTLTNLAQNLQFVDVFVSSVTVSWDAPAGGAVSFRLDASTAPDFGGALISSFTADSGATQLTVQGLLGDTTYHLRVGAFNWNGVPRFESAGSTVTDVSVDPIGPDAVTDLAASTQAPAAMRLSWSAPADPTNDPLSGSYAIQFATWSGVAWATAAAQISFSTSNVAPGDPQSYPVPGLDPNTTYYFRLWTSDPRPNWSPLSNGATNVTLADPVSGGAVLAAATGAVTAAWTALPPSPSSATAEGYRLEVSSVDFAGGSVVLSSVTTGVSVSTLTASGLQPNTTYFLRAGSLNWNAAPNYTAIAATATLANAPAREAADFPAVFASSVTAHWQALPLSPSSATAEGYRLEASTTAFDGTGTVQSSATAGVSLSTLTLSGLSRNTTYYFRVGSLNWPGAANYTALDATATLADMPAFQAPALVAVFASSITAQWGSAANPSDTQYRLEISTAGDFSGALIASATLNTQATVLALTPNTTYHAQVKAVNRRGVDTAYLQLGSTVTRAGAPGTAAAPFDPVDVASMTVHFSSGTPSNPAGTRYDVELSTDPGFSVASASDTPNLDVPFAGLTPNTTYHARARARNSAGTATGYTALGSTATLAAAPGPAAATFTSVTANDLTLNWSSGTASPGFNPSGTLYDAQISTDPSFGVGVVSSQGASLSATYFGLEQDTVYYARVRALGHGGAYTAYTDFGSTQTAPSGKPLFIGGTFEVSDSQGQFIDPSLYVDTTTPNVRVQVRSPNAPGLAVSDTPAHLALWRLNDGSGATAADGSLHGNDLSLQGAPTPGWVAGRLGSALDFDGSQNHAVSPDLGAWRSGSASNSWTVEMLFRTNGNSGYLFQTANAADTTSVNFDADLGWHNTSGNLAFALRTSGGVQKIAQASQSYADGNWHSLAAVLGGSGMFLYVDGVQVASNTEVTANSARTYSGAIHAWVGAASKLDSNMGNGSRFSNADIDEVLIATRAFSASEVLRDHTLADVQGHALGAPAVDRSTAAGTDFSWTRLTASSVSVTGANGTTAIQTITASGVSLRETASPAASTNQVMFIASDLDGNLTTAQFTVLVDTTAPAGAGVQSLTSVSTESAAAVFQSAADALSGLHAAPYQAQASTDPAFGAAITGAFAAGPSQTLSGLLPNTTYHFRARARDAAGNASAYSASMSTVTLARAVTGTEVLAVWVTSVTVRWDALPPAPSSASAAGYVLQVSTEPSFVPVLDSSATADLAQSTLTFVNLTGDTTYYFRVASLNHAQAANYAASVSTALPLVLGISLTDNVYDFGTVGLGLTTASTQAITVTNTGNVPQRYRLSAATTTAGSPWTVLAATPTAHDSLAFFAVFHGVLPSTAAFAAEDAMVPADQPGQTLGGGGRFTVDGSETGVAVPVAADRRLWLMLHMPATTSTALQQTITTTITAEKNP